MLSATSQHALRALVHLARLPAGSSLLGRDLSERAGIPANYLAKILLTLRNAGVVDASRGLGGGYRLRKEADKIRLVEVVGLFEDLSSRHGCFLGEKHDCNDHEACSAHQAWKSVQEQYLSFLNGNTVADIGKIKGAAACPRRSRRVTASRAGDR